MAFFFISHDLGLVSTFCERIAVMYRGRCVEMGKTADILNNPAHPYTDLLLSSVFPVRDYDKWVVPQVFENEEKPITPALSIPAAPRRAVSEDTGAAGTARGYTWTPGDLSGAHPETRLGVRFNKSHIERNVHGNSGSLRFESCRG